MCVASLLPASAPAWLPRRISRVKYQNRWGSRGGSRPRRGTHARPAARHLARECSPRAWFPRARWRRLQPAHPASLRLVEGAAALRELDVDGFGGDRLGVAGRVQGVKDQVRAENDDCVAKGRQEVRKRARKVPAAGRGSTHSSGGRRRRREAMAGSARTGVAASSRAPERKPFGAPRGR